MKHSTRRGLISTICIAFVIIMTFCLALPAFAGETDQTIDVDRTGEVTFRITSSENKDEIIPRGSIELYKVAAVAEHGVYTLRPDFASLDAVEADGLPLRRDGGDGALHQEPRS